MKRYRLILVILVFAILLFVVLVAFQAYRFSHLSLQGLPQEDILARLGEPDEIQTIQKNVEHYFGPIENIWYQIEMGDRIDIWTYHSLVGRQELYFTEHEDDVKVQAFFWRVNRWNPIY